MKYFGELAILWLLFCCSDHIPKIWFWLRFAFRSLITAFPSNPCWLGSNFPGGIIQVPRQSTLANKVKSRSSFKEKRVSKGNIHLGSRLGREEGQEMPALAGDAKGSYGLIAHLFGEIKILWSSLFTPNCPICHLTPWDTEEPQICSFVELQAPS